MTNDLQNLRNVGLHGILHPSKRRAHRFKVVSDLVVLKVFAIIDVPSSSYHEISNHARISPIQTYDLTSSFGSTGRGENVVSSIDAGYTAISHVVFHDDKEMNEEEEDDLASEDYGGNNHAQRLI